MFQKIISIFEIILFPLVWILLICVGIVIPVKNIPYAFELLGALTIISLFIFTLLSNEKQSSFTYFHQIAGISLLGFAAIQLSIFSESQNFSALYYLIVLSSSLVTRKPIWIVSFIILAGGETANLIVSVLFSGGSSSTDLLKPDFLYSSLCLFCCGFFPFLFFRLPDNNHANTKQTAIDHQQKFINTQTRNEQVDQKNEFLAQMPQDSLNHNISSMMTQGTEHVNELLYSIVYFMSRNFKAHSALGFIYDVNRQSFELNSYQSKSIHIIKNISIPLGKGIVGQIGRDKRHFSSGNLSLYNSELLYYKNPVEINSILAVPIISEQNELLGALVLDCIEKNSFKDNDLDILKRFSTLAAALITNTRTRFFQEKAAHMFQIFYQASHQFTRALNLEEVFDVLFTVTPMITSHTRQLSIIFDDNKNVGRILRISGMAKDLKPGFEFPINRGLYSFVFQTRKLVNIGDFIQYSLKYYRFFPEEMQDPSLHSLIILPITDNEMRCRGIFSIESEQPNIFTSDIEQILRTLIENASVAFTRATLYQKMELLATTDGLTGLNNHRHFQEILSKEIERARRYKHPVSLLLMDIDHFKNFNDTYGHPVGDLVLKEIAICIHKSIRTNDIPARYGGEEFTVIIPETDQKSAMVIAERVRITIERHIIRSLEKELRVTVSIGCASYPSQVSSQQELIDCADKALYYSKENGRNQANAYLPSMGKGD